MKTLPACYLVFIPLLTSCSHGKRVEIPNVEDIAEVHVDIEINGVTTWQTRKTVERQTFTAPREHWAPILDSFRPYERGTTWQKGYVPGGITLKLKDGTSFRIGVLVFEDDEIHPWLGPEAITHVGGSARKLHEALTAAHADWKKRQDQDRGD